MKTASLITSLYRNEFGNPEFEFSHVKKIKLGSTIPSSKRLWMIFFFGEDEHSREYLVETWYYTHRTDRKNELMQLKECYPKMTIA
jgi:hypothetical protein